jgi:hypothetical protein
VLDHQSIPITITRSEPIATTKCWRSSFKYWLDYAKSGPACRFDQLSSVRAWLVIHRKPSGPRVFRPAVRQPPDRSSVKAHSGYSPSSLRASSRNRHQCQAGSDRRYTSHGLGALVRKAYTRDQTSPGLRRAGCVCFFTGPRRTKTFCQSEGKINRSFAFGGEVCRDQNSFNSVGKLAAVPRISESVNRAGRFRGICYVSHSNFFFNHESTACSADFGQRSSPVKRTAGDEVISLYVKKNSSCARLAQQLK